MRKFLFALMALFISTSGSATTETLLYKYDFSKWTKQSSTFFYGETGFGGANIKDVDTNTFDADYGLVGICGGQMPGKFLNIMSGTSIQNFGGEIGNVLCISGYNSTVNDALVGIAPASFGTIPSIKENATGYVNLVFYTNPNNTPKTTKGARIRVKVLFNVYGGNAPTNMFNNAYSITTDASVPDGDITNAANNGVANSEFQTNGTWDPTKWMLYEFDTWCPSAQKTIGLKMETPNNTLTNGATIFIKEVSFYEVTDVTDSLLGTRRKTVSNYQIFPNTVECLESDKVVLSQGDWCNFFAAGETIPASLTATVSTPAGTEVASKYFDATTGTFKFYDAAMAGNAYTVNLNWTAADATPMSRTITVICRNAADATEEGVQPKTPAAVIETTAENWQNQNEYSWTIENGIFYVETIPASAPSLGLPQAAAMVSPSFKVTGNTIKYIGDKDTDTNTYKIYNIVGNQISEPFAMKFNSGVITGIDSVMGDNAPVRYINLQGVEVANPTNGIFIHIQGEKATKVVL